MDYILYVIGGPPIGLQIDSDNPKVDCNEKKDVIEIKTEEGVAYISSTKFIALVPKE